MRTHFCILGLLAVLTLLFFLPLVLHPNQILYSDYSDLLAEHIPAKRFLVRSWQETGEVPLWCPYLFAGSPLVHDIQVAAFYPLHLPLYLLPEQSVGAALSWLIVLHVLLAGCAMYAYCCHRGQPPLPAFIAAVGFMFGGRWLMHLLGGGHYIVVGLAWLPLVLLCLENAIRSRGLLWGLGAGIFYALLALGTQPQWTFYAGLFSALWTLDVVLAQPNRRRALLRWLSFGALTVVVAAALAAIQLLPTLEAAGQSSRAGGVGAAGILTGGLNVLLFLVGPALTVEPANLIWEDRGGLALLWLAAAVLAPVLCRTVRYQAGVCASLFLFALGGALLLQPLPGFNLFRQPARMMVIATFPVAYLAGITTRFLFTAPDLSEELRRRCERWSLRVGVVALLLCGGFALRQVLQGQPLRFHVYWLMLPITFGLAFWLVRTGGRRLRRPVVLWSGLLLADLGALTAGLVAVRPEAEIYGLPECVRVVAAEKDKHGRVLDRDWYVNGKPVGTPLGAGAPLALIAEVEAVRGYSPLDVLRYREYLQFIAGEDRSLRALDSPFTYPVLGAFPVKNRSLLDLLGVRYLLQPGEMSSNYLNAFVTILLQQQPLAATACSSYFLTLPNWKQVRQCPASFVYDFLSGGIQELGSYTVYENLAVFPRVFVVPSARPLPARPSVLSALTATDFRQVVLLEDFDGPEQIPQGGAYTVRIRSYRPNRVELEVKGDAPGYLVLADVWYPGWTCTVNGELRKVHRANYLFRAVAVDSGIQEVVFRFEPLSYCRGRLVSLVALGSVGAVSIVLLLRRAAQKNPSPAAAREGAEQVQP